MIAVNVSAVVAAAPASQAPIVTTSIETSELLTACRGDRTDLTQNFCTGYIMGIFDALSFARQICPSPYSDTTTLQAVAVTRKFLDEHPEEWSKAPIFLVRKALLSAFSCPRR